MSDHILSISMQGYWNTKKNVLILYVTCFITIHQVDKILFGHWKKVWNIKRHSIIYSVAETECASPTIKIVEEGFSRLNTEKVIIRDSTL